MAWLRSAGIGARLAAWVVLFSVAVTVVVAATQSAFEYRRELGRLEERIAEIKRTSTSALAAAVWIQDRAMAQALVDDMARQEDIARLEVLDDKGIYVASGVYPAEGARESLFPLVFLHEGGLRNIANVRVVADLEDFRARIRGNLFGRLASQALLIALVAGFLLLTVHLLVTRHLGHIAHTVRRASIREGFAPLALPRRRRYGDELDEVVDAMNRAGEQTQDAYDQLAAELALRRTAEDELRRAHAEMERRIQERTAELATANAELSAEVQRRRNAEQALRASEKRAWLLLDSLQIGAVLVSADGNVRGANRAFAERVGRNAAEIDRLPLDELLPPETAGLYLKRIGEVLAKEQGCGFDHAEGERVFAVQMVPIELKQMGGKVAAAFCRDVTLERQAEQLRDDVERITRHDLKSPVIGMLSGVQALRLQPRLPKDVRDTLQLIEDAGYLALDLVNRSLDLYRMEKGLYQPQADRVDLKALVEDVVRLLRNAANHNGVRVELENCAGGEAHVVGERALFFSMLANLVKNALEASPAEAAVSLRIERREGGLSLAIHNRGAVPAAVRGRLFEKYVSSGKHDGTGLGAYSARLIARTYGGDVTMTTDETTGTTVTVTLPVAAEVDA